MLISNASKLTFRKLKTNNGLRTRKKNQSPSPSYRALHCTGLHAEPEPSSPYPALPLALLDP